MCECVCVCVYAHTCVYLKHVSFLLDSWGDKLNSSHQKRQKVMPLGPLACFQVKEITWC